MNRDLDKKGYGTQKKSSSGSRSSTMPNFNKKKDSENYDTDNFKNSSILKNATQNLFIDQKIKTQAESKNLFSNTLNFPENVISLHQSINNNKTNSFAFKSKNTSSTQNKYDPNNPFNTSSGDNNKILVTPQLKKINIEQELYHDKQVINLEDLYVCEEKIWAILEALKFSTPANFACEDYFEFLNMSSFTLDYFFNLPEVKSVVNIANILELISMICLFITVIRNNMKEVNLAHLKNLIHSVHQNYLIVINMVMSRLPKEFEGNMWGLRLFAIVKNRQIKLFPTEKEKNNYKQDLFILKQNNYLILNSVAKYISANFRNKIDFQVYEVINDVITNIDKGSYATVRNILFNIKNSMMHYVMMNQASINHPIIPSPYLPPLPDDKKLVYTLVLDLDETLVHYKNNVINII